MDTPKPLPLPKDRPMLIRIATGIVGTTLYCVVVFNKYGLAFAFGVAFFSVFGALEFYEAVRRQGAHPNRILGCLACIGFQITAWSYYGVLFAPYLPALLAPLLIFTLLAEIIKRRPKLILSIGATLLGSIYIGWLFSYLTLLHGLQAPILRPPFPHYTTSGEWIVFFVTAVTWLSDAGALFVGRAFGRHKMAPELSPAKTWEGAVGGLLFSLAGGALFGTWIHLPLGHALTLALLCGVAGQIGDLCESALKRDLGIKDFGTWLPGHGGVLDRIDSLLFAAPVAYYYLQFFLIARH